MWSLPNITKMNEETVAKAAEIIALAETTDSQPCRVCEWRGELAEDFEEKVKERDAAYAEALRDYDRQTISLFPGIGRPDAPTKPRIEGQADVSYLGHTVYCPEYPDEAIFLCEKHDGYTGSPVEGCFTCGDCYKVFSENITWELHYVVTDCDTLCINCYRDRYLESEAGWIPTGEGAVHEIICQKAQGQVEDFEPVLNGVTLNLGLAAHLLVVNMDAPDDWTKIGDVTIDSMTAAAIPGSAARSEITEYLTAAREAGYSRALLVMDGAYQFCVQVAIYTVGEPDIQTEG